MFSFNEFRRTTAVHHTRCVFSFNNESLRKSPNFECIQHSTTTVDIFMTPWLDGCLPIVMLRIKLYDPARVFFPEAYSETIELRVTDIDDMNRYLVKSRCSQ